MRIQKSKLELKEIQNRKASWNIGQSGILADLDLVLADLAH